MLNIVKDKGEVLLSTSYQDLHKHGYKPFVRWGILKETLTAACLLESGILDRAKHSGKLYLWDPFCGSGSFLIEALMMLLNRPCRSLEEKMPFENWPIHQAKIYEDFKKQQDDLHSAMNRDKLDVWLVGSDISQKAFETAAKNLDFANFDQMYQAGIIEAHEKPIIANPLILSQHWPTSILRNEVSEDSSAQLEEQKQLMNQTSRKLFMSLYHGSYEKVGAHLTQVTDNLKDFSIITNVPYGV